MDKRTLPAMIAVGLDVGNVVIQAEAWSDASEAVYRIAIVTALATVIVFALAVNNKRRYNPRKISEINDESTHGDRKGKRQPVYEMLRNMRLNPRTQSDMVAERWQRTAGARRQRRCKNANNRGRRRRPTLTLEAKAKMVWGQARNRES